jgi:hypothetical protein
MCVFSNIKKNGMLRKEDDDAARNVDNQKGRQSK